MRYYLTLNGGLIGFFGMIGLSRGEWAPFWAAVVFQGIMLVFYAVTVRGYMPYRERTEWHR